MKILQQLNLIFMSMVILTACSGEDSAITFKERPNYEVNQVPSKSVVGEVEGMVNQVLTSDKTTDQISISSSHKNTTYTPKIESIHRRNVKVTGVIDGDTIEYFDPAVGKIVKGRLIGVNSPESTKEVQYLGKEGSEFLTKLILGQEIEIEGDPNADVTDRYGRYLIHAFIGGKSLQCLLLTEGLVRIAYLYGDYQYIDTYEEAEAAAKEAGLNIWSIPGYVDSKNGFNMEVIKTDVEKTLSEKIMNVKEKMKGYLP